MKSCEFMTSNGRHSLLDAFTVIGFSFFSGQQSATIPAAFADLGLLFHYVTVVQGARLKGCKEIVDLASDFVGYRTFFITPFAI